MAVARLVFSHKHPFVIPPPPLYTTSDIIIEGYNIPVGYGWGFLLYYALSKD